MGQTSAVVVRIYAHTNLPSLKIMTGLDCGASYNCIQDGHGYYVVSNSEVADNKADHCYWEGSGGCRIFNFKGEAGFKPESKQCGQWFTNLNWLRSQLNN